MLRVTDDHRRARIARRHGLHHEHRYEEIAAATTAMTALHGTEPATPHLSLHARIRGLTVADVDDALYEQRTLVKAMAMRRTLFVLERDLWPAVLGSAGQRVAAAERRRLTKEAAEYAGRLGDDWIAEASEEVVAYLTGRELSARELREDLDHLGGTFTAAPGTKWSAEVAVMSRLLTILAAEGRVVRAHNAAHWRVSRPLWTAAASWLGEEPTPVEPPATAYAELVRRWLRTFGPGTEDDLVWWLGSTRAAVRAALGALEAVAVSLPGDVTGWVLPQDTADLEAPPKLEPWVALLPTLDPTTMGWKERDFYLAPEHVASLFDRAGNAGTTVWVDGRIVGCWVQGGDGHVRPVLLEELGRGARRHLDAEVARLDAFLDGERVKNVYTPPLMRGERTG